MDIVEKSLAVIEKTNLWFKDVRKSIPYRLISDLRDILKQAIAALESQAKQIEKLEDGLCSGNPDKWLIEFPEHKKALDRITELEGALGEIANEEKHQARYGGSSVKYLFAHTYHEFRKIAAKALKEKP